MFAALDEFQISLQHFRRIRGQPGTERIHLWFSQSNDDLTHSSAFRESPQRVQQDRNAVEFEKLLTGCRLSGFACWNRRHARPQSCSRNDHKNLHAGDQYIPALGVA